MFTCGNGLRELSPPQMMREHNNFRIILLTEKCNMNLKHFQMGSHNAFFYLFSFSRPVVHL